MTSYVEWKGWDPSGFGHFSPDEGRYFAKELSRSGINSVSGLRIAELGFGNGAFAGWVKGGGGMWVGREAIPELMERARRAGFDVVDEGTSLCCSTRSATLDLIVAFDVIEHLDMD